MKQLEFAASGKLTPAQSSLHVCWGGGGVYTRTVIRMSVATVTASLAETTTQITLR